MDDNMYGVSPFGNLYDHLFEIILVLLFIFMIMGVASKRHAAKIEGETKEQIADMNKKINELGVLLGDAQDEETEIRKKWDKCEHTKEQLDSQLADMRQELQALSARHANLLEDNGSGNRQLAGQIDNLKGEIADLEKKIANLSKDLKRASYEKEYAERRIRLYKEKAEKAEQAASRGHQGDAIITLSEDEYFFPSREATISTSFERKLIYTIVPQIEQMAQRTGGNIVYVFGFTDERSIRSPKSNLDANLLKVFSGESVWLSPGSNCDLGAMRAAAVTSILLRQKQRGRLSQVRFIQPYSGCQMVLPNGRIARYHKPKNRADDKSRRRIEIHVRK